MGRKIGTSAVFGMRMFHQNCLFLVDVDVDFVNELKRLNDGQKIVDRIHEELDKVPLEKWGGRELELDWLYSTFFGSNSAPPSQGNWNLTKN